MNQNQFILPVFFAGYEGFMSKGNVNILVRNNHQILFF